MNYRYRLEEVSSEKIDEIESEKQQQRDKEDKAWAEDDEEHPRSGSAATNESL